MINQHWAILRILDRLFHIADDALFVVGDEDGRTRTGYPTRLAPSTASSMEAAIAPGACGISSSSRSLLKRFRSSAKSIDSGEVPMIFTPAAFRGRARFNR